MRFLVQWQHVTGATQHRGIDGLARVIGQLQGYETAVGAWEPQVLARRVRDYDPAWLDRLCHQGEVTWLRLRRLRHRTIPIDASPAPPAPPRCRSCSAPTCRGCSPPTEARRPRPCRPAGRWPRWSRCSPSKGACFASELATGHRPGPGRRRGRAVGGHGARPAGLRRLRVGAGRRLRSPPRAAHRVPTSPAAVRRPASHRDRRAVVPRARRRDRHRSRRAGRGAGRPAPRTVGRRVLRPRGRRAPGRALARPPVGAAPHGGSRARRRRPVRARASAASSSRSRRRPRPCRPSAEPSRRGAACASPAPIRSTSPASCSPANESPPAPPSGSTCPSDAPRKEPVGLTPHDPLVMPDSGASERAGNLLRDVRAGAGAPFARSQPPDHGPGL